MADDATERIPFRPVPRDFEGFPMPATVPAGLQVKEPGWEELEPMFMLTPAHLGAAMQHWGTTGTAD